jgi:hypothetical protein
MIFDESLSKEEEEDNDGLETSMIMIFNEDFLG